MSNRSFFMKMKLFLNNPEINHSDDELIEMFNEAKSAVRGLKNIRTATILRKISDVCPELMACRIKGDKHD